MRNFKLLALFLFSVVIFDSVASATPARGRRDLNLPTQSMMERMDFIAPLAVDTNSLLAAQATSGSVITTATVFVAQPDFCRTLDVLPGGTTADVPAGDVTVNGTNFFGTAIIDTYTFAANDVNPQAGTKAFCTVTSVVFPVQDGSGATYDVGITDALGLKRCMGGDEVFKVNFNLLHETTRPTVVSDADEVEKNTVDIDTALDASGNVSIWFVQNFSCLQ